MRRTSWFLLLPILVVTLLSTCTASPRSAGESVGRVLKQGHEQSDQFLLEVEKGYSHPTAAPNSAGESIGKVLKKGQDKVNLFLQGVRSGYDGH